MKTLNIYTLLVIFGLSLVFESASKADTIKAACTEKAEAAAFGIAKLNHENTAVRIDPANYLIKRGDSNTQKFKIAVYAGAEKFTYRVIGQLSKTEKAGSDLHCVITDISAE